jgi:hypothetical protein
MWTGSNERRYALWVATACGTIHGRSAVRLPIKQIKFPVHSATIAGASLGMSMEIPVARQQMSSRNHDDGIRAHSRGFVWSSRRPPINVGFCAMLWLPLFAFVRERKQSWLLRPEVGEWLGLVGPSADACEFPPGTRAPGSAGTSAFGLAFVSGQRGQPPTARRVGPTLYACTARAELPFAESNRCADRLAPSIRGAVWLQRKRSPPMCRPENECHSETQVARRINSYAQSQ